MDEKERYQKAEAFATEKHKGQFRIGGEPYIMHPLAVADILAHLQIDHITLMEKSRLWDGLPDHSFIS